MVKRQNQIEQLITGAIFRQSEVRKTIDEIVADIEGTN
jgi:hypothetical protein